MRKSSLNIFIEAYIKIQNTNQEYYLKGLYPQDIIKNIFVIHFKRKIIPQVFCYLIIKGKQDK